MPELRNSRWEKFAQLVAKGVSRTAAYGEAYNKPGAAANSSHGSRLGQKLIVVQRIEELRPHTEAASSADLDPEFVIRNLLQVLQKAVDSGKFSSANKTLELLGKFQGMFNESRRGNRQADPLDDMDSEQLKHFIRRHLIGLGPGTLKMLGFVAIEPESGETPPQTGPASAIIH